MRDVPTRRLRYALAVARHRSFTAAGAELHVAQQGLSEQVRRLEEDLGFRLFERTTRRVETTPAGERYLAGARAALDALDAAHRDAAALARPGAALRVGFLTGAAAELTDAVLDAFADARPDATTQLVERALDDPSAGLRDGTADVAFVRLPFSAEGLDVVALAEDPRVVALAADDPLARGAAVAPEDLVGREIVGVPAGDPVFHAFWRLADVLGEGDAPRVARAVASVPEEMQLVARGGLVSITAATAARFLPWPGVTFRLLDGCPPGVIAVAARADDTRADVRAFLDASGAAAAAHPDLVAAIRDARPGAPPAAARG